MPNYKYLVPDIAIQGRPLAVYRGTSTATPPSPAFSTRISCNGRSVHPDIPRRVSWLAASGGQTLAGGDGAFGAAVSIVPELRPLVRGMEEADSLAFDLHKWFHMPYEAGCVLVRDREAHRRAFRVTADYVEVLPGGIAPVDDPFREYGPQLSRGFRALKVWMGFKHHGLAAFGESIARNVRQAGELADRIRGEPELELLAPVPLNIVCFRYVPPGGDGELDLGDELDALNVRILVRLQESGVALPTQTRIRGRFAIRVSITNHRTRSEDIDRLVEEILALGRELSD